MFLPAAKIPPTLIVHGSTDELVPVIQATKLEEVLRKANLPVRLDPKGGHDVMSEVTYLEAITFFSEVLYPTPGPPASQLLS